MPSTATKGKVLKAEPVRKLLAKNLDGLTVRQIVQASDLNADQVNTVLSALAVNDEVFSEGEKAAKKWFLTGAAPATAASSLFNQVKIKAPKTSAVLALGTPVLFQDHGSKHVQLAFVLGNAETITPNNSAGIPAPSGTNVSVLVISPTGHTYARHNIPQGEGEMAYRVQ